MTIPQGFPGMSGAHGYWDSFINGGDSFHNVINVLDFPLESVEEDKGVTENWEPQFQSSGLCNSEISQGLPPLFNSDNAEHDNFNNFDRKQLPVTDISSTHVPLDFSLRNPSLFQTPSSYYVVESSSSCSAEKIFPTYPELLVPVKTRTKILRSSTFSKWHLISPSSFPKKISKAKGKKKMKKLSQLPNGSEFSGNCYYQHMPSKRCLHCQAVKTPQWRDGPMGPKTLCNACGIRYQSGHLLPDSRPIASHGSKTKKFSCNQGKKKKTKLSAEIKDDSTNHLQENFANPLSYKICTQCNVKENPQWKEGPMNPSTLCIACGVRYRSGRKTRLLGETHSIASQDSGRNEGMKTGNIEKKKKTKKLPGLSNDTEPLGVASHQNGQAKRCAHCQVTETPQWRDGPMGKKSLCNACGVRYRSGRLLREYRPAVSPTFVPSLHSNIHKKVIKMREKPIPKTIKPENDLAMCTPPETVPASS